MGGRATRSKQMTDDKAHSDRRGVLRTAGAIGLAAIGFTGTAAAGDKGGDRKRKKPNGHYSKKSGKRGNGPKKKPPGKARGHYSKKSGKRGNGPKKKRSKKY